MGHLKFYTAGESHGPALVGILEGMPANVPVSVDEINRQLYRRQQGYGRGGRMRIEKDEAQLLSGMRFGLTLGGPIAVLLQNRDFANWGTRMSPTGPNVEPRPVTIPRPGHADLAGAMKYGHADIRNVLERASARETAVRVALGAIARQLLVQLGVEIASHVVRMVNVQSSYTMLQADSDAFPFKPAEINAMADSSPVRSLDKASEAKMMALIDEAKARRDTVGGIFEVAAFNVPIGLGSYVHWDRRLDARIAAAMMSIQAIKGVEIGDGMGGACRFGSQVHDEIYYDAKAGNFQRKQNNAGGLEGGISNGMPVVVRAAMKPISTLMRPLDSVDLQTKEPVAAHRERSDVCALPAASVIGEAMLALVLGDAMLEKFGGDSLDELQERVAAWREHVRSK